MAASDLDFVSNIAPEQLEELYTLWKNGESLSGDWRHFFSGYQLALEATGGRAVPDADPERMLRHSAVQSLIYRYRDIGHLLACTDPLSVCPVSHPALELSAFGLSEADLDELFATKRHYLERATLREFLESMRETYCREIGVEFMHIQDPDERQWLINRMEPVKNRTFFRPEQKLRILEKLHQAALFEEYLHRRFTGQKRFSLEGGETLIPVLDALVAACPLAGVSDLVMGMPHRGRLNVLTNIFGKPYEAVFAEFQESIGAGFTGDGDVKYHKGYSTDITLTDGRLHLILASNPSHLEAVDPVVEGKARARQDRIGAGGGRSVLPVLLHGDAAFAGQGLVAELFNMSQLEGYSTGGTIHIVLNNQIGFTTMPRDARSTRYATDVSKMLACPVFHVHGETPEAAVHAVGLALEYRQAYGRDVVIELICYRRHGHNEGDEPAFTQPVMYRSISERRPVNLLYADQLAAEGVSRVELDGLLSSVQERIEQAVSRVPEEKAIGFKDAWQGIDNSYLPFSGETAVTRERLLDLALQIASLPDGFELHPKVAVLVNKRLESVQKRSGIDWGTAELLAYASLLQEGALIRISGQDVRRGTFNHRHAVVYDHRGGQSYCSLDHIASGHNTAFHIYDSLLSENGVLGFEYGYSLENPKGLTIWEAQFGDFANGAQVMIDQFIASGETKWNRASGLVMLLPHGYEGQGAEHSSARIERFLQLCAVNNLQVAQPTTPAQMFHLLRRQVLQPFRKPLIVFTPKSLLRNPVCTSRAEELESGGFREIMVAGDVVSAELLIVCSGRICYDLLKEVEQRRLSGVVIVTVEQLYPLRLDLLKDALAGLSASARRIWAQDEPENMGGWHYIRPYLEQLSGEFEYAGRDADSCPAVGSHHLHGEQQAGIMRQIFEKNPA